MNDNILSEKKQVNCLDVINSILQLEEDVRAMQKESDKVSTLCSLDTSADWINFQLEQAVRLDRRFGI